MPFDDLTTDRLLIRVPRPEDAPALAARRSDPEVAKYQDWSAPYPSDRATVIIDEVIEMGGPVEDDWWMATVERRSDGAILGDVSMRPTWDGRCIELGATFAQEHWGNGYAVEATQALVDRYFADERVTRMHASLQPENLASARVLERTGFLYEGHTRKSFWEGDTNSDDWLYGQTREDYQAWTGRNRSKVTEIELREVDQSNDRELYRLKTHWTQRLSVSPMEHSFADALIPEIYNGHPMAPWMRGVYADGEPVAFVMLGLRTPGQDHIYLWRLLVDRLHQRRGIGRLVVDAMVEECRARGETSLKTSWNPDRGGPEGFYLQYGFEPTGEIEDDEVVGRFSF